MEELKKFEGSRYYLGLKCELDETIRNLQECRLERLAFEKKEAQKIQGIETKLSIQVGQVEWLKQQTKLLEPQHAQKFFQDNAEILKITDFERHLLKKFFGFSGKSFFGKTRDTFKKQEIEELFLKAALKNPAKASELFGVRGTLLGDYSAVEEFRRMKEKVRHFRSLKMDIAAEELSKLFSEAEKTHRDLQRALGELLPWGREEGEGRRAEESEKPLPHFNFRLFRSPTTTEGSSSPVFLPRMVLPRMVLPKWFSPE